LLVYPKEDAIMIRTILVPLDGSTFAEHAVPLALTLGRQANATVRLLRVVAPLADYFFLPPLPGDPLHAELRELHRTEVREYLDAVVARSKDPGRVACDVIEEKEGITETICQDVVQTGTDLIVMSSHGRGAVARFWLGSNADTLVRTAPVPVLLVRPPEEPTAADLQQPVPLKHFLLALDGNTDAEKIVAPALALGKATGADYTLVHVVRPAYANILPQSKKRLGDIDEQKYQKAEEYLGTVADRLRALGATVQTRVCVSEQPASAILQQATVLEADMIALETHGRGASRLLFGSVADKVVRGSSIPVLVCRLPHQLT
jgi:nucleotide-binding universal stress UspA family protein